MHPSPRPSAPLRARLAAAVPPGVTGLTVPAAVLAVAVAIAGGAAAQQPGGSPGGTVQRQGDEEGVRAAARAYVAALERGDGRALAAMWTPDGDVVDDDGRVTNGRETVAAATPPADDASRPKFDLRETRLRFLAADVAVEDGEVTVTPPGSTAVHTGHFTALWVRQAGAWKLAGLRESRIGASTDAPRLTDLEWMVGEWTVVEEHAASPRRPDGADQPAAADQPAMEVSVRWDEGRAFLLREMKVLRKTAGGTAAVSHITQRIGWDPLSRQLRSWSFGSDGGRAESIWSRDGDTWVARAVTVLPDGTQTSSLNIYSYDGADRCTWRSLPTHVGGEHLHQTELTMVRKKGAAGR